VALVNRQPHGKVINWMHSDGRHPRRQLMIFGDRLQQPCLSSGNSAQVVKIDRSFIQRNIEQGESRQPATLVKAMSQWAHAGICVVAEGR